MRPKPAGGKGDVRIFFSLNEMDTFRQTLVDSAAEQAAQMGAQFTMEDAQGSIERQVEQLKNAAAGDYDVIICSPVSVDTVVQLKMSVGDIPIVFVNSCRMKSTWRRENISMSAPVSRSRGNSRRSMCWKSCLAGRSSTWC